MDDERYPISTADVVATLAELFDAQSQAPLAKLLRLAEASISETGSDNWNGRTTFYALDLALPVAQFARLEAQIPSIEETIQGKIKIAFKRHEQDAITTVAITPAVVTAIQPIVVRPDDEERLWGVGTLKLFLSHVSEVKLPVAALKSALQDLGVAAFVAHEDIDPSREWQLEIEKALASMDAMAAILTTGFHDSQWTDQEVGYALARKVVIVPVRIDVNPYGFMGRHQAMRGRFDQPVVVARGIGKVLASQPETKARALEAYVRALETASSWDAAKALSYLLIETTGYSDAQVGRIRSAVSGNDEVRKAFRVPERLNSHFGAAST